MKNILLILLSVIGLYFVAAFALSSIPVNAEFKACEQGKLSQVG
jgi:hypothetical protein